jgi:hypothetical protein
MILYIVYGSQDQYDMQKVEHAIMLIKIIVGDLEIKNINRHI